jgi:MFS transporter, ENTS family, enterobactin (siderophore) exporter
MRSLLPDITPLRRSPSFRRFFLGQIISLHGSQMAIVALRYQAYDISNKTLVVGLLAMAQLVPLLIAAIGFGQLADVFDRRRILLITQIVLALTSVALALNARSAHPKLWLLFVLGALASFAIGIDWPTRSSFVPGLVGDELLPSAIALNAVLYNLAAVVGPILAGFVVQRSVSTAFWLDAASYVVLFTMIGSADPQPRSGSVKLGFGAVGDGLRYLKRTGCCNRLLRPTLAPWFSACPTLSSRRWLETCSRAARRSTATCRRRQASARSSLRR